MSLWLTPEDENFPHPTPFPGDFQKDVLTVRIPMIPPSCSEGVRRVNPKEGALLFQMNPPPCSGRIGAKRRGCFNCFLFF
jgi:hypothetical protein